MKPPKPHLPDRPALTRRCKVLWFAALVLGASIFASAKDAPLTAIILFDGAQGPDYVQVAAVALNGKAELRLCDGVPRFNKNAYNALPRISLKGATSLERGTDGVLALTVNDKPLCAVPANLRFDQKPELTPAEAADQAVIQGTPVSAAPAVIPAFKPGVQLVFIDAPNAEFASFLCAQRANTTKDWQDFLVRYPATTRRASAQNAMAGIHQQAAEAAFAQFQKTGNEGKQDLAMLRQACSEAQIASQLSPGYKPALKVLDDISRELDNRLEADRARMQAYQRALQDHTPGHAHLTTARADVDQLLEVRPDYVPSINLLGEINAEEQKLETAITKARSLGGLGRYDEAVGSLGPYRAFAPEMPRIEAVIRAAFKFHLDNGQKLAAHDEWEQAAAEFRKAVAIRPESKEAEIAVNNATNQLTRQRDQKAANAAVDESNEYASKNQIVEAYDVLADLPDKQRALVASQLSALASVYVPAATRRAQSLQEGHLPIRGRADEDAVLDAYVLLDRASSMSDDPAITVKRDFLSSKISAYYLDLANRYLHKPSGAGAGVGWLYLSKAQHYGITNLDDLKEEMARYEPLYQRRARLSMGIAVRDQTSRSDNHGFADQLVDAIAAGLDPSAVAVDIAHKAGDGDAVQDTFTMVGEVLEHRVVKNATLEAPLSKYRAATYQTKNPAWIAARSEYETAEQQLDSARSALTDAQTQHKKKEVIAAANDAVQEAQRKSDQARQKLETTEQDQAGIMEEAYHYTKKTIDVKGTVELAFRFQDRDGNAIGNPGSVRRNSHKTVVVLQDVKPEDTQGITNQGVEPDEAQFLTDLEIEARNEMVKVIREKAEELPIQVLQRARALAQNGDVDGAAEQYILYLNSTSVAGSQERDEAAKFLQEQFNLASPPAARLLNAGGR